jgi:hypothetical protein
MVVLNNADGPPVATGRQRWIIAANRCLAPVMFSASMTFLLATYYTLLGVRQSEVSLLNLPAFRVLLALYPLFLMEACLYRGFQLPGGAKYLWSALCPPLRLIRRDLRSGTLIWWPVLNWTPADCHLARFVTTGTTGLLWIFASALLAAVVGMVAFGRSLAQIADSFLVEGLLAAMWTIVVAEFCVMAVTLPWARVWRLNRLGLLIALSPLVFLLMQFYPPRLVRTGTASPQFMEVLLLTVVYTLRLVRGARAWNSLSHWRIRDPQERLAVLEKQLEQRVAEVDDLRRQIRVERESSTGG